VCYSRQQSERKIRKHRYDSIVEGVGLDRVTANFDLALIDDAESIEDQEIVDMAHWLLREEGLFVGSSSAMNVVAASRAARKMKPGSAVVTVICDSGQRHLSRFWNPQYLEKYSLIWPEKDCIPDCLSGNIHTFL
jgi:cysteine synthase A